jgi:hypothetical protein
MDTAKMLIKREIGALRNTELSRGKPKWTIRKQRKEKNKTSGKQRLIPIHTNNYFKYGRNTQLNDSSH